MDMQIHTGIRLCSSLKNSQAIATEYQNVTEYYRFHVSNVVENIQNKPKCKEMYQCKPDMFKLL